MYAQGKFFLRRAAMKHRERKCSLQKPTKRYDFCDLM
jgi:hypothetical protein